MTVGMQAVNPASILTAIETQLVAGDVVDSTNAIHWLMDGEEPPEKPIGQKDVLLCVTRQMPNTANMIGGGRIGRQYTLWVDVRIRVLNVLDKVGTSKDRLTEQWSVEDTAFEAMHRFFPTSDGTSDGNAYTIAGFMIDGNYPPHPDRKTPKWGQSIGVWKCEYIPIALNTVYG